MRLFLDTSVLLSACGSSTGASREIFRRAPANGWRLIVTHYVIDEVVRNLHRMQPIAITDWNAIQSALSILDDVFTMDRPAVFGPAKDRPVLFGALAWADVLLTLDQSDFGHLMERPFYGLRVVRPGVFLEQQKSQGRLL